MRLTPRAKILTIYVIYGVLLAYIAFSVEEAGRGGLGELWIFAVLIGGVICMFVRCPICAETYCTKPGVGRMKGREIYFLNLTRECKHCKSRF